MSEQNKEPNVTEPIQKGMEAADKIKGAIKTSKAISGMAKGGAAAGPYGAVAVALWENKELVAKLAIVISFLSALPILFILLLPSIILVA